MTDLLEQITQITKAHSYDLIAMRNRELREICKDLVDALQLAMRQLEDPTEDINAIRQNAKIAIDRARRA